MTGSSTASTCRVGRQPARARLVPDGHERLPVRAAGGRSSASRSRSSTPGRPGGTPRPTIRLDAPLGRGAARSWPAGSPRPDRDADADVPPGRRTSPSSARLLDSAALGKQRVETLQILRAIELPDYGWANHPAVLMWRGRTPALVAYGLAMARIWQERGFADSTASPDREFAPEVVGVPQEELAAAGLLPSWLGNEELHRSHRSNLIAKDPGFYRRALRRPVRCRARRPALRLAAARTTCRRARADGVRVWVVRPRGHDEVGACVAAGVVGLGTQSGVDVDATGLSPTRAAPAGAGAVRTAAGQGPAAAVRVPRRRATRRPGRAAHRGRRRAAARRGRRRLRVPGARTPAAPPSGPVGPRRSPDGGAPARHAAGPAGAVPGHRSTRRRRWASASRRAAARSAGAPGHGRPACRRRRG